MKHLKFNNFYILLLIIFIYVLTRIPNLGYDTFNTDVWRWKQRSYDFSTGVFTLNFEQTIQKYHPGVSLMWINTAAIKVYNLYYDVALNSEPDSNSVNFIFELNFLQKIFISIVIGICLALTYIPLSNLFGRSYSLITIFLLSLEPFYVALTREIHLEGLMTTFMLVSFVYWYYFLKKDLEPKYLVVSALFAALATLTKTSGVFIVLFNSLLLALHFIIAKDLRIMDRLRPVIINLSSFICFFIIFYFLIWPAMLAVPEKALGEVINGVLDIGVEGGHEQIYFGALVSDPGPFYYFLVLALRSSIYVVVGFIGALFIHKKFNSSQKKFIISCLLFCGIYLLQLTLPTKKLDRYILPSLMALVFIAGFFFDYIYNNLSKKYLYVVALVPSIFTLSYLNPDYLSYFNPIFGGLSNGIRIFEPKWVIGHHEMVAYFSKLKSERGLEDFYEGESIDDFLYKEEKVAKKLVIALPEKYYAQIWPFFRKINGWAVIESLEGNARLAKYFVYPVWEDTSHEQKKYKLVYFDSIYLRGVKIWNVYEKMD